MIDKKILLLSDIHSQKVTLKKILEKVRNTSFFASFVVGDISNFGTKRELFELLRLIRKYVPKIFFVLGNCDPVLSLSAEEEKELKTLNIYWVTKPIDLNNFVLIGFNGTKINPFKVKLNQVTKNKQACILTHIPPFNTLADSVSPIRHIGSQELRLYIETHENIFLNVCGHVHEAPSVSTLNKAIIVNPGPVTLGNFAVLTISENLLVRTELMSIYD